jgi:tetratricopeptide (TPR) repeat protein
LKAISAFERAITSSGIQRNDDLIISYYQLGKLYNKIGNFEKSKFFYHKAIEIEPNFPHALGGLASLYNREGNDDLADRFLLKAYKLNPGGPSINFNMGLHSLKKYHPDKAIRHLMSSQKDPRLKERSLFYLAIAYKQKGVLGKAAVTLRRTLSMNGKNITPHLHLMEIYSRRGHVAKSQNEALVILGFMIRDENLLYRTTKLILEHGHLGHVQLDGDIIFPILFNASTSHSEKLNAWRDCVEKILKKEGKID